MILSVQWIYDFKCQFNIFIVDILLQRVSLERKKCISKLNCNFFLSWSVGVLILGGENGQAVFVGLVGEWQEMHIFLSPIRTAAFNKSVLRSEKKLLDYTFSKCTCTCKTAFHFGLSVMSPWFDPRHWSDGWVSRDCPASPHHKPPCPSPRNISIYGSKSDLWWVIISSVLFTGKEPLIFWVIW